MKKIKFELIYVCLGIFAFISRITFKDSDTVFFMSVINRLAGFVTLLTILSYPGSKIVKDIKERHLSFRRMTKFLVFSVLCIILYWILITFAYIKFENGRLNDLITIATLTFALSDTLWSGIIQTLCYKK